MNKIKCAVVGVGYLGKFHAEKYAKLPNAELVAVCDTDEKCCHEIATLHNVNAIKNYQELLGKINAVSIVVPTTCHYSIAKFFLDNNIHVLLEKPITNTVEEANELINIAKMNKLILQIGHLERFNPVLMALKNTLEKPLFIESLRLSPFKLRSIDVNVILDLMIHDIDIVQYLVDSPIKQIHASGAPVLSNKADIANVRIEFMSGCVANVTASRISLKSKRHLRIFQHNAYFSGDLTNKTLGIHRKGNNEMFPGIPEIIRDNLSLQSNDALLEEIKAFLDSITNKTPPLVSGEDGMRALQTATQITQIISSNIEKYHEQQA
ncbi:MAG: UDP-N-acetyl-D-glucosamine dehydrogenase [Coxiella sp. DG_40]|nr:MAG: UDP-N-acetyl-D-glucosamine dehydrogenase [Coxiella sp. DG_40]